MGALSALAWLLANSAWAGCVDIDADAEVRPQSIVHTDAQRAGAIAAEAVACVGLRAAPGERPRLEGAATVLDADTFVVADRRVRLIGIDAPEKRQLCDLDSRQWPCGQVAASAVVERVGSDPLTCEAYGFDRWGRALAVCYVKGADLNAAIVRAGWALAWYPAKDAVEGPTYEAAEAQARQNAVGLWQGVFTEPWLWRRQTH